MTPVPTAPTGSGDSATGANTGATDPAVAGRRIIAWIIGLAALTGIGVGLTHAAGTPPGEEFIPAVLLVAYAPTLAALAVLAVVARASGVWALLRKVGSWRAGWQWYALVILVPLLLVLGTNAVSVAFGGSAPPQWLAVPTAAAIGAAAGPWFSGAVEEIAWRGFAQPLLQLKYGALGASVVIGIIWATWHEWPLLTPGGWDDFSALSVGAGYVRLIATAVLYAWLYNSTRSLLLVIVAHVAHNAAIDLVPIPADAGGSWAMILAVLYLVLAVVVVSTTDPRTLTRRPRPVPVG